MLAPAIFLAVTILPQTNALDQKVTFTCAATRATEAIARLSRLTGVTLSVQGLPADEMLVLRFEDEPLHMVMDKVAYAATGRWEADGSGFYLDRPGTLIRTIEHEQRAARVAAIRKL